MHLDSRKSIGAFEAKTHLSKLLEEVDGGASFTITRNGKPVARLTPFEENTAHDDKAMAALRALRSIGKSVQKKLKAKGKPPITRKEIREWISEGRR